MMKESTGVNLAEGLLGGIVGKLFELFPSAGILGRLSVALPRRNFFAPISRRDIPGRGVSATFF
jgi:hypothetical protein